MDDRSRLVGELNGPDAPTAGANASSADETREIQYLLAHLSSDKTANIILKGHLVIEERLTDAVEACVSWPEFLDEARLTFAQKLLLCRSASPTLSKSPIWEVLSKLNTLRNAFSHSLDGTRRSNATENLLNAYAVACGGNLPARESAIESLLFTCVLAMCLGFISAVKQEIEQAS